MIRPFEQSDAAYLFAWQQDFSYANFFRDYGKNFSIDELRNIQNILGVELLMYHADVGSVEPIGVVSAGYSFFMKADIGILVDKRVMKKGHARILGAELLDYLKCKRGIRKVTCRIVSDDLRVEQALLADGFFIEGVLEEHAFMNGEFKNETILSKKLR